MDDAPPSKAAKPEPPNRVEGAEPAGSESQTGDPSQPKKLTPEEQMALYEDNLKENDWGHQPC